MGQKIAVFVVLTQAVRTDLIVFFPVVSFAVNAPVEIAEGDLTIFGNGLLNGIDAVINGLVHAFYTAGYHDVALHQLGVMLVALVAQFLDQFPGFFLSQVFAGKHCVNEQL